VRSLRNDGSVRNSGVPAPARAAATTSVVVRPYHVDPAAAAATPQPNRSTWNNVVQYVFGM
jgi:hypothetical protein